MHSSVNRGFYARSADYPRLPDLGFLNISVVSLTWFCSFPNPKQSPRRRKDIVKGGLAIDRPSPFLFLPFFIHHPDGHTAATIMDSRSLRTTASQETLVSLLQLEPQPIPDTDKDLPPLPEEDYSEIEFPDYAAADGAPPRPSSSPSEKSRSVTPSSHARTSSLGLSGSPHGSIYYRTSFLDWSTRPGSRSATMLTIPHTSSPPYPALVNLRPLHLHRGPPLQHLTHPPCDTLRPRLGILPPPRPRNLPNPAHRTSLCRPTHRSPHCRRRRLAPRPTLPKPQALWRRHTCFSPSKVLLLVVRGGKQQSYRQQESQRMATPKHHLLVRLRLCALPLGPRLYEPPPALTH